MTIQTASILKDGTVATTGGTAKAFSSLGNALGQHDVYFDGSDYLTRLQATFSAKTPKVSASAPSGYTQSRQTVVLKVPKALASGATTINTIKIEFAVDVETTDAEKSTMLVYGAQLLHDSDFAEFWKAGSTS